MRTQQKVDSTYTDLLARLNKIDGLIAAAARGGAGTSISEILEEWQDILLRAINRIETSHSTTLDHGQS